MKNYHKIKSEISFAIVSENGCEINSIKSDFSDVLPVEAEAKF